MPTRLYLRDEVANQPGAPMGTAATDSDGQHVGAQRLICLTMSLDKGGSAGRRAWDEAQGAASHRDFVGMWISPALASQTLGAGQTFSLAYTLGEDGPTDGHCYPRSFVYLWRPGMGWVATLCAASAASRDTWGRDEVSDTMMWRRLDFPGLGFDIEARLRDRIVAEIWVRIDGEPTQPSSADIRFNGGTDDYDDGEVVASDAASFLEYSGDLILAQEVTMNSANILVGARDLRVDGANVGALDGGATVTYEPTHIEHTVDQRMGVQRVDKVAERMTITANLKEAALENLRIAWGQPATALSTAGTKTTLHVGGAGAVTEHALVLTGKAPGTNMTRTITCHKAVAIETSAHSYTKDGATVYPVTFVLVEDPTQGEGFKYMTIEDDEGQFAFA